MKHIHPFPARMAPEIAIEKVQSLRAGQKVLDPMTGSGMVLAQAAKSGIDAIGVDLDPLAELISRVGATGVKAKDVEAGLSAILSASESMAFSDVSLPWVDAQTAEFMLFWFADKQRHQLHLLAYAIHQNSPGLPKHIIDVLKVALSRLIITKEPKASLARDTAHSRPHRTIEVNDFDVFAAMPGSVRHVLSVLNAAVFTGAVSTQLGDARDLIHIEDRSIDLIITSPPYLNAIDYMRGHRLSLVWLGYGLTHLRQVRGTVIGAEKAREGTNSPEFEIVSKRLRLDEVSPKTNAMLQRYYDDLVSQAGESFRVLKPGATATYVVGNCTIKGKYVQNSELMKEAAIQAGFQVISETERDIPNNRRYMPVTVKHGNSMGGRMRKEHIIDFRKVA